MKQARDGIFKSKATESSRSMSDSGNRTMMARLLFFTISSSSPEVLGQAMSLDI
jgi:hypothetical protein